MTAEAAKISEYKGLLHQLYADKSENLDKMNKFKKES